MNDVPVIAPAPRRITPEERAERVKRLKRKQRRHLAIFIAGVVAVLLVIISIIMVFAGFRLQEISVSGTKIYKEEDFYKAAQIVKGDSLLFMDAEKVKENILLNMPYIDSVEVTKKLHNTLILKCKEAVPTYSLKLVSKGTYLVLSGNFRIIEENGSPYGDTAVILSPVPTVTVPGSTVSFVKADEEGKAPADKTLDNLKKICNGIKTNKIENVTQIDVTDNTNAVIVCDGRIFLNLGAVSAVDSKLDLARQAMEKEAENNPELSYSLDLSYEKKAFVEPMESISEEPEEEQVTDENGDPVETDEEDAEESYEGEDGDSYSEDEDYSNDDNGDYSEDNDENYYEDYEDEQ